MSGKARCRLRGRVDDSVCVVKYGASISFGWKLITLKSFLCHRRNIVDSPKLVVKFGCKAGKLIG
jgi:hypothetical protein